MPQVTVVAKVRSELLRLIAPTRNEDGCIEYRLHQDHDDPAVFIFYENWENESSLARHMESEHFKNYVSAVDGMLVEKKRAQDDHDRVTARFLEKISRVTGGIRLPR
jgi:quinol monooxygenase YgiN